MKKLGILSIILSLLLIMTGCSNTINSMIKDLDDKDEAARQAAVLNLAKAGEPAVEPLIIVLAEGTVEAKINAIEALSIIKDSRATDPLINLLSDGNPQIRAAAVEALGFMNDEKAIKPLVEVLKDTDEAVRQQAEKVIKSIGLPAVKYLFFTLKNGDAGYNTAITDMITAMGDKAVEPILTAFISDKESPVYLFQERICKNFEERDPQSFSGIIGELKNEDSGIRWNAMWRAPVELKEDFNDAESKWKIMQAMGEDADKNAPVSIELYLSDKSIQKFYMTLKEIIKKIGAGSIDPLLGLVKNKDTGISLITLETLCELSELKDARVDEAILESLSNSEHRKRVPVITALGNIKDPRATDVLLEALKSDTEYIRNIAADALIKHTDDIKVIEYLVNIAWGSDSGDAYIASKAKETLGNMVNSIPDSEYGRLMDTSGFRKVTSQKLQGKVIIIDKDSRKISELFWQIPVGNMALPNDLKNVNSVMLVDWGEYQVGTYSCSTLACVNTCTVTVIDRDKQYIIGEKKFEGSQPPEFFTYYGTAPAKKYGDKPEEKVLEYIKSFLD